MTTQPPPSSVPVPSSPNLPGAPDGKFIVRDDAGTLRQQGTLAHGKLHGPFALYDEHGRIAMESQYSAGMLDGMQQTYVSGRLHQSARYHLGRRQGETEIYGRTGSVSAKMPYVNGFLHGNALFFDADGSLVKKTAYQGGKLHGESTSYYPSGQVLAVEPHEDDLLHGEAKWYSENGSVTRSVLYNKGKPVQHAAAPGPVHAKLQTALPKWK
jgi:antitoxin component YwqK of YwqJK toxin-antitoxin module